MTASLRLLEGPGVPWGTSGPLEGYVEKEYSLTGGADALDPDGAILDRDVPFATRVLIRRPVEQASGTVIVEPFHNIHEMAYMWRVLAPWILASCHTWIGVTVHSGSYPNPFGDTPGGIPLLRESNPERYDSLHLGMYDRDPPRRMHPGPAGFDPIEMRWRLAMAHPQGAGIATALLSGLRRNEPLGVEAERIVGVGASQTGNFWRLFLDGGHHTPDIDAYVVMVAPPPTAHPAGATIVSLLSEGEVVGTLYPRMTEALGDSEEPVSRGYEMAGTAHLLHARDVARAPGHDNVHNLRPFDALPRAVLANLDAWLRNGIPMPPSAHIVRDPRTYDGIGRDEHGNASGGLRGPWLDVPTAQYLPRCTCSPTMGEMIPFGDTKLKALYGSRDAFEDAFRCDVIAKVAGHIVLPEDAERLCADPE